MYRWLRDDDHLHKFNDLLLKYAFENIERCESKFNQISDSLWKEKLDENPKDDYAERNWR